MIARTECGLRDGDEVPIGNRSEHHKCPAVRIYPGSGLKYAGELGLPDSQRTHVVDRIDRERCGVFRGLGSADRRVDSPCPIVRNKMIYEIKDLVDLGLSEEELTVGLDAYPSIFRDDARHAMIYYLRQRDNPNPRTVVVFDDELEM